LGWAGYSCEEKESTNSKARNKFKLVKENEIQNKEGDRMGSPLHSAKVLLRFEKS
jgi:hypothetical protein